MNLPIDDSLVYSTVDTNMGILLSCDISRHPGHGFNPLPCQRHHRSLIVELVASSPGHTTGDHRRRHGTHASAPLEMDLVGIGLILVLGVILGADANDAYVIPLDLSPSLSGPQGPASRHLSTRPWCPAGQCLGASLSGHNLERWQSGNAARC